MFLWRLVIVGGIFVLAARMPSEWAYHFVVYGSSPAFLLTGALVAWFGVRTFPDIPWTCKRKARAWLLPSLTAGLLAALAWTCAYPFAWRVVSDEFVIAATSRSLASTGRLETPLRGYYSSEGSYAVTDGFIDKRPSGYPTLGAILHRIAGYDPHRLNQVNMGAAGLLVALLALLGGMLSRWRGWTLGASLAASLPLLALLARSGTNEIVALLGNLLVGWWAWAWLRKPSQWTCGGLLASGVLLTHFRYEGILWMAVIACALWMRRKAPREAFGGWMPIILLLAAPPLIQQWNVHLSSKFLMQAELAKDGKVFALEYIWPNLVTGWRHFIWPSAEDPSNPGLWIVLAGSLALLLASKKWGRGLPVSWLLVIGGLVFLCQPALLLAHYWGQFDSALVWRHLLPLYAAGLIALLWIFSRLSKRCQYAIMGGSFASIALFCAPRIAFQTADIPLFSASQWLDEQTRMAAIAHPGAAVVSSFETRFVALGIQTINMVAALEKPEVVQELLSKGIEVYAYLESFDLPGDTVPSSNWDSSKQLEWTAYIQRQHLRFRNVFNCQVIASFDSGGPFLRKHYWIKISAE